MCCDVLCCAAVDDEETATQHMGEAQVVVGVEGGRGLQLLSVQALLVRTRAGHWPPAVSVTGIESVRDAMRSRVTHRHSLSLSVPKIGLSLV